MRMCSVFLSGTAELQLPIEAEKRELGVDIISIMSTDMHLASVFVLLWDRLEMRVEQ